jgi:hypothetical protein
VTAIDDPANPGLGYAMNGQAAISNGLAGDFGTPLA